MKQIPMNRIVVFLGVLSLSLTMAFVYLPAKTEAQTYYGSYPFMYQYHYPYRQPIPQPVYYPPQPSPYQQYYYQYQQPYYNYSPLTVSCSPNGGSNTVGSYTTWTAYASGGSGYYNYVWNGTDNPTSLNLNSIGVQYQIPGTKYMYVTVTSGNGQATSASCGSVYVVGYVYNSYYPQNYYQYPYQYPQNYQYSTPSYSY